MRQNWTFTLSLILHGAIAWWLINATPDSAFLSDAPIQIELRDKDQDKIPVMDTQIGKVLKQIKDQAKRFSKENRRVEKETSAMDDEPLKIMGGSTGQGEDNPSKLNPLLQNNGALKSVVTGQSTRGEFIPGLKQGSFTALNTDQFTYYTFFARMNEQIKPRWVSRLRDFGFMQSQQDLQKLAQYPRTTQVEFVLDRTGKLLQTIVHLTSSYRSLDIAATDAFKDSAPINNPPEGLVGEDGKIHLFYNFTVHWNE